MFLVRQKLRVSQVELKSTHYRIYQVDVVHLNICLAFHNET